MYCILMELPNNYMFRSGGHFIRNSLLPVYRLKLVPAVSAFHILDKASDCSGQVLSWKYIMFLSDSKLSGCLNY